MTRRAKSMPLPSEDRRYRSRNVARDMLRICSPILIRKAAGWLPMFRTSEVLESGGWIVRP